MAYPKIKILSVILLMCVNSGVSEKRYNSCVTWRDDLLTLTITCRVSNFTEPITISHDTSRTIINCSIAQEKQSCSPIGKNITVDWHNHTVSLQLIELKSDKPLQGRWQCAQGETTLYTNVSFSEGIISDSWVHIHGRIIGDSDRKKDIIVECSSCRKPEASYVEFLVNNRSHGSMLLNKHDGVCTYKKNKCNPTTCNCSSSENVFSLRLPFNNTTKDIACEMYFQDEFRKGKFRTIASLKITEEDVILYDSITDIVVPNKYKHTIKTPNITDDINQTVASDRPMNNQTSNSFPSIEGLSAPLAVVISVGMISLVIMVVVLFLFKRPRREKICSRTQTTHPLLVPYQVPAGQNTESMLLEDIVEPALEYPESILLTETKVALGEGKGCEGKPFPKGIHTIEIEKEKLCEACHKTNQSSLCVNCEMKICSQCKQMHQTFPHLNLHVIVPLQDVPIGFYMSMFCHYHNNNEIKFVCINEEETLCAQCVESRHSGCNVESLETHATQREKYFSFKIKVKELTRALERLKDILNINEEYRLKEIPGPRSAKNTNEPTDGLKETDLSKVTENNDTEKSQRKHTETLERKIIEDLLTRSKSEERNIEFIENNCMLNSIIFNVHYYLSKKLIEQLTTSMEDIKSKIACEGIYPIGIVKVDNTKDQNNQPKYQGKIETNISD